MASYNSIISGVTGGGIPPASPDAGALIPLEYQEEVISLVPAQSAALSLFRTVNMGREIYQMPVLDALPEAEWVGSPSAFGTPGSENYTGLEGTTSVAWKAVQLTAHTVAINVPIPRTVLSDAMVPIWSEVTPLIAAELGRALDKAVVFGYNSPFTGPSSQALVPAAIAAGNVYAAGTATKEEGSLGTDIAHLFDLVESGSGFDITGVIASKKTKAYMRELARTTFGSQLTEVTAEEWYGQDVTYAPVGAGGGLWPVSTATGLKGTVAEKTKEVTLTTGATTELKAGDTVQITGLSADSPNAYSIDTIVSSTKFTVNYEFTKADQEATSGKVTVTVTRPIAVAGDFSQAIIGVRQDLEAQLFTEGVITNAKGEVTANLMTQNMVNLRVQARFGYATANSITYYNPTESTRFPVAVLNK